MNAKIVQQFADTQANPPTSQLYDQDVTQDNTLTVQFNSIVSNSVSVAAGDTIHFRINKAQSGTTGNNTGDTTDWNPTIIFTPNP